MNVTSTGAIAHLAGISVRCSRGAREALAASLAAVLLATAATAVALPVTTGLIGYWPANGNGADQSGFGRDLTLNGGLGFGDGVSGQAFSFRNNDAQYASRTVDDAVFNFGTADFTLQVWATFRNLSDEHTLFEKFIGTGGPGWTLTQTPQRSLQFYATNGAILDVSGISSTVLNTNAWHHVLVRRAGNTFALFLDGAVLKTGTSATSIGTNAPLRIGSRQGEQRFPMDGRIDEAAIWDRALTDAEVRLIYETDKPPVIPPPPSPTVWLASAGGNGHAYEFVLSGGIGWDAARAAAAAKQFHGVAGHLATATSAAENEFLQNLILQERDTQGVSPFIEAWLGGYQTNPAGPANESWTWVTGEPWSFTNWDSDEPNDVSGGEQYLGIWGPQGDGPIGRWNDQGGPSDPFVTGNIQGYLVEYAIPEPCCAVLLVAGMLVVTASRRLRA